MTVWDDLDDLLERYDSSFRCDIGSGTAWGGQLRLTLTNPDRAPSRSMTFYSVGGTHPADVARKVLDDAAAWLAESGVDPLPVPEWLRAED